MGKRTQFTVASIFVAMIVAPLIVGAFGYKARNIENRGLVAFPPLTSILSDPQFFDHLKGAIRDQLPLRAEMLKIGAWVDMTLFNHNYNPDVRAGRSGWLFLRNEVYSRCTDPVPRMVDGIKMLGDAMASHDIRFIFSIAPDKAAIYQEKLGPMLRRANECPIRRRAETRTLMAERAGPYFVDVWTDLLAAKAASPRLLYRVFDTHWSPTGAAIAAKAVVNRLHQGLWDESALVVSPPQRMKGDLNYLEGLDRSEPVQAVVTVRPGVVTRSERFDDVPRSQRFTSVSSGPYLIPGRTVLLHDSFFEKTMDLLAPYFEEIIFVHADSRERQETIELVAKTNTFILGLVERSVHGAGWYYHPDYQRRMEQAMQRHVVLRH